MELSEEKRLIKNDIPDKIMMKVSVGDQFVMPSSVVLERLGIKLDQYEVIADKAHSWMNKLSDTLSFD